MFGMSNEQIMALIRQLLPVMGGIAVSFGWLTAGQMEGYTTTILQVTGPMLIVISTVWSLIKNTQASMVASVAAMPVVKSIHLEPTVEGAKLAAPGNSPPNVTVAR
jgi:hypothetical protein